MQVEVKILVQTITAQYGVLSEGDILRTTPEFAAHLVNDCGAATYTKGAQKAVEPTEVQPGNPAVEPVVSTVKAATAPAPTTKAAAAPKNK